MSVFFGNPASPPPAVNLEGQDGYSSSAGPHTGIPRPSAGIHADAQIWAARQKITKVQGIIGFYRFSFEV